MNDQSQSAATLLRRYALPAYGPTALFALGEGAIIPLLPVFATQLGASIAVSSLVAAALVVGQLCGNLPAGWAVARFGERLTMIVSGLLAIGGVGVLLAANSIPLLMLAALLIGFCGAAFALARHAFMTTRIPVSHRARALALLGGSFRLGLFVGPFIAAALLWAFQDVHANIWFLGACIAAAVVLVWVAPDIEKVAATQSSAATVVADTGEPVTGAIPVSTGPERVGVFRTMWQFRDVLSRLGVAAALLSSVRSARQAILPLWGVSIGLDPQTLTLVIGISGAIDFALFYASGQVMDRFGRLWAAVPALTLMGAGFVALSFTHDVEQNVMWFATFAMLIGVGNGLSSGILMTLGADTAPQHDPAPYLGSWRTLTDAGGAITPLAISAITAAASISLASGFVGVIAALGVAGFLRWIPRFAPTTTK